MKPEEIFGLTVIVVFSLAPLAFSVIMYTWRKWPFVRTSFVFSLVIYIPFLVGMLYMSFNGSGEEKMAAVLCLIILSPCFWGLWAIGAIAHYFANMRDKSAK